MYITRANKNLVKRKGWKKETFAMFGHKFELLHANGMKEAFSQVFCTSYVTNECLAHVIFVM